MLTSLSHIVIDELHERDLFADFLTIVLRSAMARHPHLRLVLMSATVRESLFSEYFGGCPVIRVPGRGLLSSTIQLNLSQFCHTIDPKCPLLPLDTS